jgi:hypothetical protein
MPTLLAFSRQEAQFDTKMTKPDEMRDQEILREWVVEVGVYSVGSSCSEWCA